MITPLAPAMTTGTEIELLNTINVVPYAHMAFPSHRRAFASVSHDGPCLAVGASSEGVPAGLAFGEVSGPLSKVHSLFVSKNERSNGMGTTLLTRLEAEMYRLGARRLRCSFLEKPEQTAALVRVLRKCGWPEPVPHKLYAKFTVARMLEAPFMREYEFPSGFRMVFWRELTSDQRTALQHECENGDWIPARLRPFKYEASLEERNSLALLHEDRVIGWNIIQQLHPAFLTYSCSYMHPRFAPRGFIFNLYVQSVRLQARDIPEISSACLVVPMDMRPMVAFVRRRLGPFLSERSTVFETIKECRDPLADAANSDLLDKEPHRRNL